MARIQGEINKRTEMTMTKIFTDDEEIERLASTIVAVINCLSGDRPGQMEYVIKTLKSLKTGDQEIERVRSQDTDPA
jgi:hypothetical protein